MGFMRPVVYETDYLDIDGPMGCEVIPCDVADYRPTKEQSEGAATDRFEIPSEIAMYCENTRAHSIERKHGWVGRYSAPGYMDCTSWTSGESEAEVRAELDRLYGDE
jgi:hypothetical protein